MCAYMHHVHIHTPHAPPHAPPNTCVCIFTPYTYRCITCKHVHQMHHQTPSKYKIYLVGLPSELYERPGKNERYVLNQLFLLLFRCFSVLFRCFSHENHHCVKSNKMSFRVTTKYRSFETKGQKSNGIIRNQFYLKASVSRSKKHTDLHT